MVIEIIIPFNPKSLYEYGSIGDIVAAFHKNKIIIGERTLSPDEYPRVQQWAYLTKIRDNGYKFNHNFQSQPKKVDNNIFRLPNRFMDLLCEISPEFQKNLRIYSLFAQSPILLKKREYQTECNINSLNQIIDDKLE